MHIPSLTRLVRVAKEAGWIVIGQGLAVLGSVVGVRLMTEMLPPAEYGELALWMTVATLVNQSILGPLNNGISRFYAPAVEKNELGLYLRSVRSLVLSASGIIALASLVIMIGLVVFNRTRWFWISGVALTFAVLSGYNAILSGIQNAARQRTIVAFHQGLDSWMRPLAAVGALLWIGGSGTVTLVGYSLSSLVVLASQWVFFCRTVSEKLTEHSHNHDWRDRIMQFSWPFATWGIFTWAHQSSDRWALAAVATTEEVGRYVVLFQVGYYPMTLATGLAVQLIAPILFQRSGDASNTKRNMDVNRLCWHLASSTLVLTAVAFCIGLAFHGPIFAALVATHYGSSSYLLPWVILSGGIFAAGQVVTLELVSRMQTGSMIAPKIVTSLLGISLNFTGAHLFGTVGLIGASSLTSLVYLLWIIKLTLATRTQTEYETSAAGGK